MRETCVLHELRKVSVYNYQRSVVIPSLARIIPLKISPCTWRWSFIRTAVSQFGNF
jgi:hypothetical protein